MLQPTDENAARHERRQAPTVNRGKKQVYARPDVPATAYMRENDSDSESVTSMLESITYRHQLYQKPFIASRHTVRSDEENIDPKNLETGEDEVNLAAAGTGGKGGRKEGEGQGGGSGSDGEDSDFSYLREAKAAASAQSIKKAKRRQAKQEEKKSKKSKKKSTKKQRGNVQESGSHSHRMIIQPDTSAGLKQLELAIRKAQQKGETKASAVHLGFSVALALNLAIYVTGALLAFMDMYVLQESAYWPYCVSSLILLVAGGIFFLTSMLAMWLGLHCYSRTVVISQFCSLALFLVGVALILPTREVRNDNLLLPGIIVLFLGLAVQLVVLLVLLNGGIRSDAQIFPSLTTAKQLELAAFLVRTAEEERRQDLARLEEEARRVDLKTAEYRSKLGEKSALCDRFRAESDSAQQELAEHHRERKQWQLDQQDENLHKAKTVLGQAESRHTQVREQLQGDFARLQDELGASRKDGQQWEMMCGEQTAKLEKRDADLEHLREENLRITHKATFNIDSSMQEVDALKAERAQLQQELADAQAHTRTRTHTHRHL
jgi:hypothetical protein